VTFFYGYHDVTNLGVDRAKMHKAFWDALKPGGELVVGDYSAKPGVAERKLEELSERVRGRIANFVYAEGNASMEEVVAQLLTERKIKLAVAESCTGGLIGHRLTNVPGSSKFFIGDFVTFAHQSMSFLKFWYVGASFGSSDFSTSTWTTSDAAVLISPSKRAR